MGAEVFPLDRAKGDRQAAPTSPAWQLPIVDPTRWIGADPPERRWIVDGWLARGTAALLVGEDGVGKSLLAQQLAASVASGRAFLGLPTTQAPALYITCEDDENELWRRQRSINRAIGVPVDAAPALLSSLVGYIDVGLGWFDPNGTFELSPAFQGILAAAKERGVGLLVLDNVAHLFTGNENARRDVATFCSALDRLAIELDATVLVLAHPNKAGAEYSGSTGWSAHVRQRWFMERPETAVADRDVRVLRKSKANYSAAGEELNFRWHEWAFAREADLPPSVGAELAAVIQANVENERFLHCLAKATAEKRATSPNRTASNYAPRIFAGMTTGKGITEQGFEAAMERLLHLGTIRNGERVYQRDNRAWVTGLALAPTLAPTPAPTLHEPCTDLHTDQAQNVHQPARTHPPSTTYYRGAAHEAAAPLPDPDDIEWPDQAEEHDHD